LGLEIHFRRDILDSMVSPGKNHVGHYAIEKRSKAQFPSLS